MVSIAVANVKIRKIQSFAEFEQHMIEHLDAEPNADIFVFPEFVGLELLALEEDFTSMTMDDIVRLAAYTGPFTAFFEREARERKQYILAGSQIVDDGGGHHRNRAFLFGPDGFVASHDKTHLFPAEGESPTIQEGQEITVVDTPFGRVGIVICYEIQFPEVTRAAADRGADIVLNPSMTFTESGSWRVLHCGHARAIENQIFVAASQLCGDPFGPFPASNARSAVIAPSDNPWAATPSGMLAGTNLNNEETVLATVNIADLRWVREHGDARNRSDRRRRGQTYERWAAETTALEGQGGANSVLGHS